MHEKTIRALQARRAQIRTRWEALLRIEKVTTPLANPDTLVFALNQSLDEIFTGLRQPAAPLELAAPTNADWPCPWRAYYRAGEQALLESLILLQARTPALDPATRDQSFARLKQVIGHLTQREVSAWRGLGPPSVRRAGDQARRVRPRASVSA
jgi:hypothetical protein